VRTTPMISAAARSLLPPARAGHGLALALLWLTCAAATPEPQPARAGYLNPAVALHIEAWLPGAPADDSMAKAADVETFFRTRVLVGTARAEEAHADDVPPAEPLKVAPRFTYLLGITVSPGNAPVFLHLMSQVRSDAEQLLAPVKKSVGSGGRHRPFVEYPQLPHCEISYAGLADTGSYPSGHATLGWLWGSLLAEIAPQYADQLLARGMAFGDSRVVCGFHYPSDVAAGRLAAAALLARLHADPAFLKDLAGARKEITALLGARGPAGH
jgi:acid phosphatase (class A)